MLAGLLYAGLLYYREHKFAEAPGFLLPLLFILRFFTISLISFLLLSPVVRSIKEDVRKPIVIVAEDRSQSITAGMNPASLSAFSEELTELRKAVGEKYETIHLTYGGSVSETASDTFDQQVTNISQALQFIYEGYSDRNIGAVVLTGDGIFNEGINPAYQNIELKAPVYTVGLGDTSIRKDAAVANILHNKILYLGDKAVIETDIKAKNCAGQSAVVSIDEVTSGSNRRIDSKNIRFDTNEDFQNLRFEINGDKAGVVRYRIGISSLPGEVTYANNVREFYIEVLDARQRILILANGPHPDVSALSNAIESNKNYEVTTKFVYEEWNNLASYDLVVFHNLPSAQYDVSKEIQVLDQQSIPRWFIVGTQVVPAALNRIQDVLILNGQSRSNEYFQPQIVDQNRLFELSPRLSERLNQYPPLTGLFGEFKNGPTARMILTQKIKKISTNFPLLSFSDQNGIKAGVLAGEGLWRWRIFDYQEDNSFEPSTELINKCIQFLTVKDDKRKFRVNTSKNQYRENEDVLFDAQLYNDSYELINTADVGIVITNEDGKEYRSTFSKTQNYYTLNSGHLPGGRYRFEARTTLGGQELTSSGFFRVEKIQLEQYDLQAKHFVLQAISEKYNGRFFPWQKVGELKDVLVSSENIKPTVYTSTITQSVLHSRWIFFVLLFLLALEWFMRRFFGSY